MLQICRGRAASSVWWPGLYEDISKVRSGCWRCDSNAPSQPKEPPVPLPVVEYPFQQVCSDYFSLEGVQYLVMVDRYSGWPSVHQARDANDKELICLCPRRVNFRWGVDVYIRRDSAVFLKPGELNIG